MPQNMDARLLIEVSMSSQLEKINFDVSPYLINPSLDPDHVMGILSTDRELGEWLLPRIIFNRPIMLQRLLSWVAQQRDQPALLSYCFKLALRAHTEITAGLDVCFELARLLCDEGSPKLMNMAAALGQANFFDGIMEKPEYADLLRDDIAPLLVAAHHACRAGRLCTLRKILDLAGVDVGVDMDYETGGQISDSLLDTASKSGHQHIRDYFSPQSFTPRLS